MIRLNRKLDSNLVLRSFAKKDNVVGEVGVVEHVTGLNESARAGGVVCTAYIVLDSMPHVRTRVTGLTNAIARQISSLKPGDRVVVNGRLQNKGYIIASVLEMEKQDGVEVLAQ
jgi:hypothetical protein